MGLEGGDSGGDNGDAGCGGVEWEGSKEGCKKGHAAWNVVMLVEVAT